MSVEEADVVVEEVFSLIVGAVDTSSVITP
jgi:hypothetical protein